MTPRALKNKEKRKAAQTAKKVKTVDLPSFRGGSMELLRAHEHEVILCGPADTSKTWACCVKSLLLCSDQHRSGVHGIMVRKLFNSIQESGARTFNTITNGLPIVRTGGKQYTDRWTFPNGSELVCAGLDNPGKLLSSEWDFIQVIQAEQLTEDEWEMVAGRCTGRGATVAWPQIFGDCNPAGSMHWLRKRKSLRMIPSIHKDNPALYDDVGNITEEGSRRIGFLESTLTGVRRKRLLDGIWATAEGAVYDIFDSTPGTGHVRIRDPKEMKRWFLAIDEGYTNPAVILLVGEDSDKRHHCFREFYRNGVLQADVVAEARRRFHNPAGFALLTPEEIKENVLPQPTQTRCERAAVDEAAAGLIADLNNAQVYSTGAKGRVLDGINLVQNRLKIQKDGKPRYTVDPSCVNHINEFESYVWNDKSAKDTPTKENDHSMDAYRYLLDFLHEGTGAFGSSKELTSRGTTGENLGVKRIVTGSSFFG